VPVGLSYRLAAGTVPSQTLSAPRYLLARGPKGLLSSGLTGATVAEALGARVVPVLVPGNLERVCSRSARGYRSSARVDPSRQARGSSYRHDTKALRLAGR